jgi:hypothetical protein
MTGLTTILSIWGAVLSTALFVVKMYELTKSSFRRVKVQLHADYNNRVNTFTILNSSSNPINICYYDIFYATAKRSREKLYIDSGIDGDLINIHINPYEQCNLRFEEAYYFNPNSGNYQNKCLFICLHESGTSRVVTRLVK